MQHLAIEILSSFINRKGHGIQLAYEKKNLLRSHTPLLKA
jgi:hypothetical protein